MASSMKRITLLLTFSLISVIALSQKPSDLELWTGGSIKLKIDKKWSVGITEQFRFNDGISTLSKSFTELGVKFKINKSFSLKGGYRYINRPYKSSQHRIALDGNYDWSKKDSPLSFAYRLRFQNLLGNNKTYIRNKIKLGYKLSKLVDPFVAYEAYFRLNGKNEFRVSRFTIGLDWRIIKPLHLTTYYRIQDDIFVKKPERQYIIGMMLAYKLDLTKKKNSAKIN